MNINFYLMNLLKSVKSVIRKLVPKAFIELYRCLVRSLEQFLNRNKTAEEVFTEIYKKNKWGGSKGEYYSGSGSVDEAVISPYIQAITDLAYSEGFNGLKFVDLGCGDFRIGRRLLPLCAKYCGVDVVKPLLARNQDWFGNEALSFEHLDIVSHTLPKGDVCFVRQVFQHLSNQQIKNVLPKLKAYKWVFITEHYPTENSEIRPNIDKVHGGDIRLYKNSGVYLAESPFDLPIHEISLVLEVPGSDTGEGGCDRGVIRTYLYKPNAHLAS